MRHGTKEILSFSFGGMTDKAILRTALLGLGRSYSTDSELEREMDEMLSFYLSVLAEEVARTKICIHDGMLRAMDMADARQDVALGLGTGNVRKGAEAAIKEQSGYTLNFQGPVSESNVADEVNMVENAINRKVAGIVLAPSDPDALVPVAKKAWESGIPLVLIDSAGLYFTPEMRQPHPH